MLLVKNQFFVVQLTKHHEFVFPAWPPRDNRSNWPCYCFRCTNNGWQVAIHLCWREHVGAHLWWYAPTNSSLLFVIVIAVILSFSQRQVKPQAAPVLFKTPLLRASTARASACREITKNIRTHLYIRIYSVYFVCYFISYNFFLQFWRYLYHWLRLSQVCRIPRHWSPQINCLQLRSFKLSLQYCAPFCLPDASSTVA